MLSALCFYRILRTQHECVIGLTMMNRQTTQWFTFPRQAWYKFTDFREMDGLATKAEFAEPQSMRDSTPPIAIRVRPISNYLTIYWFSYSWPFEMMHMQAQIWRSLQQLVKKNDYTININFKKAYFHLHRHLKEKIGVTFWQNKTYFLHAE